jgi:eukaryotic-like serine/threonine-protein kinase
VHIVECEKEQFGLAFVPVKYPTAAAAGLKCDRYLTKLPIDSG